MEKSRYPRESAKPYVSVEPLRGLPCISWVNSSRSCGGITYLLAVLTVRKTKYPNPKNIAEATTNNKGRP
jgi:hypothetical protein